MTKPAGWGLGRALVSPKFKAMDKQRSLSAEGPRPLLAVTLGDAGGVSPEVALRGAIDPAVLSVSRPLLIGPATLWRDRASGLGLERSLRVVDQPEDAPLFCEGAPLSVWEDGGGWGDFPALGEQSAAGGRLALRSIKAAVRLCQEGRARAVVTAPVGKESFALAGGRHPGHTEMLAELCGVGDDFAMMMAGGGLRVVLATIHVALAEVPGLLTRERLERLFRLMRQSFARWGVPEPRLGVCGLNPHAGDGGLFGREEIDIIAPAIQAARDQGARVEGPLSADTIFHRQLKGDFDVVVALYHDQGLIPVKTLAFDSGVNITLGLPFPRTSPDHGPAYDIARRGAAAREARPDSMIAALRAAAEMAQGRLPEIGGERR
jgi:4-hydroxythreonine-4-phosphate dehydrogenase